MKKLTVILVVSIFVVALLLAVAGCGNDDTESSQQALCQALSEFQAALEQFDNLTASSTMGDLTDAEKNLESAWNDVVSAAQDYSDANIDNLETAYDNLIDAINNIPSTDTVVEALQSIQPQAQAVVSAWQQLFDSLNCQQYQDQS